MAHFHAPRASSRSIWPALQFTGRTAFLSAFTPCKGWSSLPQRSVVCQSSRRDHGFIDQIRYCSNQTRIVSPIGSRKCQNERQAPAHVPKAWPPRIHIATRRHRWRLVTISGDLVRALSKEAVLLLPPHDLRWSVRRLDAVSGLRWGRRASAVAP